MASSSQRQIRRAVQKATSEEQPSRTTGAFGEVIRRKSTENYNALPYISALLCKSLWAFYGTFDPDGLLIVTVKALTFVGKMNIGILGAVISATVLGFRGSVRQTFIRIICAVVTIAMYAAPLSVMRWLQKCTRWATVYLAPKHWGNAYSFRLFKVKNTIGSFV
ncbi:hypothetical protein LguiA_026554 [Lonicera macranthoides]